MLFAPVLDEVAAWMAGSPAGARGEPDRWAYRLRDAVALVRPDWVVTHHDPLLEAAAIDASTRPGDLGPAEVSLPRCPTVAAQVELTRVLAGLFPDTVVAASLTGPAGAVEALTGRATGADPDLLADCGDALAELVGAHVGAGAARVLVWEPPVADGDVFEVADAHTPILRKLEMLGVPGVLCGGGGLGETGYAAHALVEGGRGALLINPEYFGAGSFEDMWADWAGRLAGQPDGAGPGVVVSAGPLPYASDPALLRAAGRRPR